jgi:oligoendopeptidase F
MVVGVPNVILKVKRKTNSKTNSKIYSSQKPVLTWAQFRKQFVMSKENNIENTVVEDQLPEVDRLSEVDRMTLELAKSRRHVALAQAEKALAQNETAELAYKYTVIQLYMKYGLTEADAIDDNGKFLRGGAVQK